MGGTSRAGIVAVVAADDLVVRSDSWAPAAARRARGAGGLRQSRHFGWLPSPEPQSREVMPWVALAKQGEAAAAASLGGALRPSPVVAIMAAADQREAVHEGAVPDLQPVPPGPVRVVEGKEGAPGAATHRHHLSRFGPRGPWPGEPWPRHTAAERLRHPVMGAACAGMPCADAPCPAAPCQGSGQGSWPGGCPGRGRAGMRLSRPAIIRPRRVRTC